MRQFYGTYNVSGDEGFAVFQAKTGNQNYVPTELVPVSTAGEVAGGKLQFVQGTIGTNADGSQSLTGITACSETDITTSAAIGTKEGNNEKHPYLVFDMYLRNISAKTEGIDELLLNKGSSVFINTASTDDGEQEGKGVSGTGLEYSARVGMIVYGNTVSVTAEDDATLGSVGEQIRGINANNSEVAAIWEPNYLEHTQYVVNNNGRGLTATSQLVTTYGIKSAVAATADKTVANVNADTDTNSDGIEDTNSNLVAVKTFKPAYTTVNGGIDDKTVITNISGNAIGLAPNQISKVRVYIWLEGQDPDCIDMASTGDKLNINLKLTKEPNTITENGYTGQYTGGNGAGGAGGAAYVTADTLPVEDYGKYVTNYVPTNGVNDEGIGWRIFHADTEDDNIYLIADTYVPVKNEAGTKNYVPTGYSSTSGRYGFSVDKSGYNGTADIASNIANKWLKKYTTAGYTATSTKEKAKATAFLLDIDEWSGFKNNAYADYAIGAPTIELFAASYNKTHPERTIKIEVIEESEWVEGYYVTWNDENENSDGHIYYGGISGDLYVINNTFDDSVMGMWLASPCWEYPSGLMFVSGGDISCQDYGIYEPDKGSRPIICLNDSVELEKQADGNYKIVE